MLIGTPLAKKKVSFYLPEGISCHANDTSKHFLGTKSLPMKVSCNTVIDSNINGKEKKGFFGMEQQKGCFTIIDFVAFLRFSFVKCLYDSVWFLSL